MKIGLINVDSRNFPNLCLMKLSAHHRNCGDTVEWWNPAGRYDIVYKSKVFTDTYSRDNFDVRNADQIITGGTGYGLTNYLPDEVEHIMPDYSLYPQFSGTAYGFLSRGCSRGCSWCMLMSMVSSCAMMMQGVLGSFGVTTFQSDEAEMVSVEDTYTAMEEDLQYELDHYAALHPGYDEYHVSGVVLGHDPLVLTSILSAKYGEYTAGEVYATLMELFDKQYTILESVTADPEGYTICSVTLECTDMEDLIADLLTAEQQEMYEIYMATGGNYADLFAGGEDE